MIYKQPSGNAGEYYPAFFEMRLKVDHMIDLNTCANAEFALFFHEYIHFLQDITTTYCLTNCYYIGENIQSIVTDINNKHKKGDTIIIPYVYNDNKDYIEVENQIRIMTLGDVGESIPSLKITEWSKDYFTNLPNVEGLKEITGICVSANDSDIFSFGAYAIKENMAYIMERLLTKDFKKSDDYPYCAAEKIVEFEYPEFGRDILNVLALCDCSLMFTNPAHVFYDILKDMKSKNYVPKKPQDLYAQLPNAKISTGNNKTDVFSHFKIIGEEARKKMKSYFYVPNQPELHEAYHKWIDKVMDYAIYLRTKTPHFLIELCSMGQARTNSLFADIVKNVGTPLMRDMRQEYFSIKPDGYNGFNVELLKAVKQLYNILHDGKIDCELYPWCKNSNGINPTIDICLSKPWERCKKPDLCPVALLWKNWGLSEYTFKKDEINNTIKRIGSNE